MNLNNRKRKASLSTICAALSTDDDIEANTIRLPQLPDLVIECIFYHFPSGRIRVRCERVCRQWRRIGMSMWRSLREIDICDLVGFADVSRGFGEMWYYQKKHIALAEYKQSNQIIDFLIQRGRDAAAFDFDAISVVSMKHLVITKEKLHDLLAFCQHLQVLHLLDVISFDQSRETFCDIEVPADASERHASLRAVVVNETNITLNFQLLLPHVRSLSVFGYFYHRLDRSMRQLVFNSAATLKALFVRTDLSFFLEGARHTNFVCLFPSLRWLRFDLYELATFEQMQTFLGLLPANLACLMLQLGDTRLTDVAHAFGQCQQILRLNTLAISFFDDILVNDTISRLIVKRLDYDNLPPMRLMVNFPNMGSFQPSNGLLAECQMARVELVKMRVAQWPTIDDVVHVFL